MSQGPYHAPTDAFVDNAISLLIDAVMESLTIFARLGMVPPPEVILTGLQQTVSMLVAAVGRIPQG